MVPMPINVWTHKLQLRDVFHDEDRPFEERRDEIVRRIKAAPFYRADDLVLVDIVEEIADAEEDDEFNYPWNTFYDYCDLHRIWIETF